MRCELPDLSVIVFLGPRVDPVHESICKLATFFFETCSKLTKSHQGIVEEPVCTNDCIVLDCLRSVLVDEEDRQTESSTFLARTTLTGEVCFGFETLLSFLESFDIARTLGFLSLHPQNRFLELADCVGHVTLILDPCCAVFA